MPGEAGARAAGANLAIVALFIFHRSRHIFGGFRLVGVRQRPELCQSRTQGLIACRRNASPGGRSASQAACPTVATLDRKDFSVFSCSATKSTPALQAEP